MLSLADVVRQYEGGKPWFGDYIRTLYDCAVETHALLIYEVGVFTGKSSNAFLSFLTPRGGRLISCDINPDCCHSVADSDFRQCWQFHLMSSEEFLAGLEAPADLVYLDGDHSYGTVSMELPASWRLVRPGGLLVVHDVEWPEEKRALLEWIPSNAHIRYASIGPGFAIVRKAISAI